MTSGLVNKDRFCVPPAASSWPFANTSGCYWGVPSISADDPKFLVPGGTSGIYWRGETWAPQAFLVYLGLQRYGPAPSETLLPPRLKPFYHPDPTQPNPTNQPTNRRPV